MHSRSLLILSYDIAKLNRPDFWQNSTHLWAITKNDDNLWDEDELDKEDDTPPQKKMNKWITNVTLKMKTISKIKMAPDMKSTWKMKATQTEDDLKIEDNSWLMFYC